MTTGESASAAWTSRRNVERSRRTAHASRRTVLIALAANGVVAVAKLAGGLLSGSAALLAEAAHSRRIRSRSSTRSTKVVELLTMTLGPNSLLVAARIDLADGLEESDIEELSDQIDGRLAEVVPDVTEVFLDATKGRRRSRAGAAASANQVVT